jgi:hypothetical protein
MVALYVAGIGGSTTAVQVQEVGSTKWTRASVAPFVDGVTRVSITLPRLGQGYYQVKECVGGTCGAPTPEVELCCLPDTPDGVAGYGGCDQLKYKVCAP